MRDRASTEDLITPCVTLLDSLALHHVRDDWVNNIWDGQFTESQVRSASLNDYWWTFLHEIQKNLLIFPFNSCRWQIHCTSLLWYVIIINHLYVVPIHRMINQYNSCYVWRSCHQTTRRSSKMMLDQCSPGWHCWYLGGSKLTERRLGRSLDQELRQQTWTPPTSQWICTGFNIWQLIELSSS